MVIKNGKHQLVGFVDLGTLHEDMKKPEGKLPIRYTMASNSILLK